MSMTNIEITENILKAIDVIVDERIKHVPCDVTDICIIVDDSKAKNGEYTVTANNGASKYKAISESSDYKKDEKVRVSIPNGDYSGDKYIVGKCVDDEAIKPITYVSPLETVIDVSGNLINQMKSSAEFGLVANGAKREIPIWSADLSLDKNYQDLQATGIYNTITLTASFKSLLGQYSIRGGNYGLRLDVYVKLNTNSDKYIVRSVYLDSSEMFGDPYNFLVHSPQGKKFDLSALGTVDKIGLWFYQNNNFSYFDTKDRELKPIPNNILGKTVPANLNVKNIHISFGSDLSIIEDNTLQGFSLDSKDYRYIETEQDNQKRFGFLWYNKNENNQYLGFSDGLVDFETKDGEIVYVTKKDQNGQDVLEPVSDENGKIIIEFKRNSDNEIMLQADTSINESGQSIVTYLKANFSGITLEEQLEPLTKYITSLETERTTLKDKFKEDKKNKKISEKEYNDLLVDVDDYIIANTAYVNTYITDFSEYFYELKNYLELEKASPENVKDMEKPVPPEDIIKQTYVQQYRQQPAKIQKVKHYDELTYLEESEADTRLVAQMGKEKLPEGKQFLELAANLSDAKPLIEKIFSIAQKDIISTLRNFDQRTGTIDADFKDTLKLLLTSSTTNSKKVPYTESQTIGVWLTEAQKAYNEFITVCDQFFEVHCKYQECIEDGTKKSGDDLVEISEALETWLEETLEFKLWYEGTEKRNPKINLYNVLYQKFNLLIQTLENFLSKALSDIQTKFSGYQGIYDTYSDKINKNLDAIKSNLEKINTYLENVHKNYFQSFKLSLNDYFSGYTYIEYNKKDFSDTNNKYSIYWYRYEPGYTSDDRFIKTDWKRLITEDDFGLCKNSKIEVQNFGLPIYDDFICKDEKYYFSSKTINTPTFATRMMDGTRKEEKYKIILFYNHEMYESNEIVYTNLDDVPDPATVDKTDAITIKHEENSQETYQSYSMTNVLANPADASKNRTISVHYEGVKSGDEVLAGAQVYWYIPDSGSMLTYDNEYLTSTLGFSSDKNIEKTKKPDYSKEGYTCFYKKIKIKTIDIEDDPETKDIDETGTKTVPEDDELNFVYKIKNYYMSTANRNTILCKVIIGEYVFETEIPFTFASLGSSGTDYTLVIAPASTQCSAQISKPLPLSISLYDYKNTKIPVGTTLMAENGASNFTINWEGPTSYTVGEFEEGEDGGVAGIDIILPQEPTLPEDITNLKENENPDSGIFGIIKASANCPIQYKVTIDGDKEEEEESGVEKTKTRNVELISYYPVPYSVGDYYIEGATSIIYDSMGSNPSYYKDPYKIFKLNTGEDLSTLKVVDSSGKVTDKNHYDVIWRIAYYKSNGTELVKLSHEDHSDYELCKKYMPYLNEKNGITPNALHMSDMSCWCAAECWVKDLTKKNAKHTLYWVQPILIIKNRYSSPMLNSWDGSLEIDKDNGTIMSSMLGAGRKSKQNTFEGVLLGEVEENAEVIDGANKTGIGLYGFNDGAQSFGFRIDGTGFIGKSGRGRIEFDGNKGVIKSASYSDKSGQPSFGMKIDLDDGFIDMRGGTEFDEEDWRNLIIEKYKEVLGTGIVKYTTISKDAQEAILSLIEQHSKTASTRQNLNQRLAIYLRDHGSAKARAKYLTTFQARVDETRLYALSTLRECKFKKKITIKDAEGKEVSYDFTTKQYNAIVKKLDKAILAETYDGENVIDDAGSTNLGSYKSRYGKLAKPLVGAKNEHQSRIHIDVESPYFYVVTEDGKRIINIGDTREVTDPTKKIALNWENYNDSGSWAEPNGSNLKKSYYLKSQNFVPTKYDSKGNITKEGAGFLLDLDSGQINSHNFSVSSKYLYLDGYASEDKHRPYFIIKDNDGHNLIYASTNTEDEEEGSFFIQSHGYANYYIKNKAYEAALKKDAADRTNEEKELIKNPPVPDGMKINLKDGTVKAYDFTIKGIQGDGSYKGSYILLDSTPKLVVNLERAESLDASDPTPSVSNVNLLYITPEKFLLHSNDWGTYTDKVVTKGVNGSGTVEAGWNIRKKPGTDQAKTGSQTLAKKYTIYATGKGQDGDVANATWYKIGTNQWVVARAFSNVTLPTEDESKEVTYKYGMEFNINKGILYLYRGDSVLRIGNDGDDTYGIYLGGYADGVSDWKLKLGWDGQIVGKGWILDENGWRKTS